MHETGGRGGVCSASSALKADASTDVTVLFPHAAGPSSITPVRIYVCHGGEAEGMVSGLGEGDKEEEATVAFSHSNNINAVHTWSQPAHVMHSLT